jgi:hypothetical protein
MTYFPQNGIKQKLLNFLYTFFNSIQWRRYIYDVTIQV